MALALSRRISQLLRPPPPRDTLYAVAARAPRTAGGGGWIYRSAGISSHTTRIPVAVGEEKAKANSHGSLPLGANGRFDSAPFERRTPRASYIPRPTRGVAGVSVIGPVVEQCDCALCPTLSQVSAQAHHTPFPRWPRLRRFLFHNTELCTRPRLTWPDYRSSGFTLAIVVSGRFYASYLAIAGPKTRLTRDARCAHVQPQAAQALRLEKHSLCRGHQAEYALRCGPRRWVPPPGSLRMPRRQ
eukprot:scaffold86711_cov66-Phaeocystis_antarctica.AAC.5